MLRSGMSQQLPTRESLPAAPLEANVLASLSIVEAFTTCDRSRGAMLPASFLCHEQAPMTELHPYLSHVQDFFPLETLMLPDSCDVYQLLKTMILVKAHMVLSCLPVLGVTSRLSDHCSFEKEWCLQRFWQVNSDFTSRLVWLCVPCLHEHGYPQ